MDNVMWRCQRLAVVVTTVSVLGVDFASRRIVPSRATTAFLDEMNSDTLLSMLKCHCLLQPQATISSVLNIADLETPTSKRQGPSFIWAVRKREPSVVAPKQRIDRRAEIALLGSPSRVFDLLGNRRYSLQCISQMRVRWPVCNRPYLERSATGVGTLRDHRAIEIWPKSRYRTRSSTYRPVRVQKSLARGGTACSRH